METKHNKVEDESTKSGSTGGATEMDKFNGLFIHKTSRLTQLKLFAVGFSMLVLILWACVVQLATRGQNLVLEAFKYKFSRTFPLERDYASRGYLMVSSNGGLNQMRSGICDMITIARYMNVTLVVPQLDKTSFWNDHSQFNDIFDEHYLIDSLRDEVKIIKELPFWLKAKYMKFQVYSMPPISWSNMSYFYNKILPLIDKYGVVHFTKTDSRLANNGIPDEVQKLRCRVNYKALRFIPPIEELSKKIVTILRTNGPFMVLHLRYEMDMIAFSGCTEGCTEEEVEEVKKMRYSVPWWKEKEIDSEKKRRAGLCPLTPEETTLALRAFGIDPNMQVYIAAGNIYGGERRMAKVKEFFPNLVKKETLLAGSDLERFRSHSNQMAALDYAVSIESDLFVMSYREGHMAVVVEGHRRFLGFKKTINLDQKVLVGLIDEYRNGTLSWDDFSRTVKETHANRTGTPTHRLRIPGKPKLEDSFYRNPEECL